MPDAIYCLAHNMSCLLASPARVVRALSCRDKPQDSEFLSIECDQTGTRSPFCGKL